MEKNFILSVISLAATARYFLIKLAVFCLLSTIVVRDAYAYLDMGTGSYILQLIFAALFGALFIFKSHCRKFISFFLRIFRRKRRQ